MSPEKFSELVNVVSTGLYIIGGSVLAAFTWWMIASFLLRRASPSSWTHMLIGQARMPGLMLVIYWGVVIAFDLLLPESWQESAVGWSQFSALPLTLIICWAFLRWLGKVMEAGTGATGSSQLRLPKVVYELSIRDRRMVFFVVQLAVWILIGMFVLNSMGISLAALLAFGGAGGLVLGFAGREILADIIAGFVVMWGDDFEVGEWIKLRGTDIEGVVEKYELRHTLIRTFDRRPLFVPNSMMTSNVIENPQRMTHRRIYEYVGLRYDDLPKLPAILDDVRKMLSEHKGIASNQIQMVAFDRYGASAIEFYIYCMTSTTDWLDAVAVKENVLLKVADIVEIHGAEFAFPTTTLHIASTPQGTALPPTLDAAA